MLGRRLRRGKRILMYNIQTVETSEMIDNAHRVITQAFITVANEFHFTKERVPYFPAFISVDVIINQIKNGLVLFVYVESGKVIGTIGIHGIENNVYKIERLAVLPDHRRKNIGKILMNYAIESIKKRNGKVAKVNIVYENTTLKKWYENQGFKVYSVDSYEYLPFQVGVLVKELW